MQHRYDRGSTPDRGPERAASAREQRQPYIAPVLEPLGSWSALTLEQSVGIAFIRAIFGDQLWWPDVDR